MTPEKIKEKAINMYPDAPFMSSVFAKREGYIAGYQVAIEELKEQIECYKNTIEMYRERIKDNHYCAPDNNKNGSNNTTV